MTPNILLKSFFLQLMLAKQVLSIVKVGVLQKNCANTYKKKSQEIQSFMDTRELNAIFTTAIERKMIGTKHKKNG